MGRPPKGAVKTPKGVPEGGPLLKRYHHYFQASLENNGTHVRAPISKNITKMPPLGQKNVQIRCNFLTQSQLKMAKNDGIFFRRKKRPLFRRKRPLLDQKDLPKGEGQTLPRGGASSSCASKFWFLKKKKSAELISFLKKPKFAVSSLQICNGKERGERERSDRPSFFGITRFED